MRHGSVSTYNNYHCHCDDCRAAKSADVMQRRASRYARRTLQDGRLIAPVPAQQHGSAATYTNWGCRCVPCTEANRLYCWELRQRR